MSIAASHILAAIALMGPVIAGYIALSIALKATRKRPILRLTRTDQLITAAKFGVWAVLMLIITLDVILVLHVPWPIIAMSLGILIIIDRLLEFRMAYAIGSRDWRTVAFSFGIAILMIISAIVSLV